MSAAPTPFLEGAARDSAVAGRLDVRFISTNGRLAVEATGAPPLELRGPFRCLTPGAPPRYFLRNVTAGVFGGDDYRVRVRAESGARLRVQPTAATRVYESRGAHSCVTTRIEVAAGADLTFDAGTTILQHGADLEQSTELTVHPTGTLRYLEVVALGRLASGERLTFDRFASRLGARTIEGRALYEERFELSPLESGAVLDAALGEASVIGTLLVLGDVGIPMPADLEAHTDVLAGISALPRGEGFLVRALGARVEPVRRLLEGLLASC